MLVDLEVPFLHPGQEDLVVRGNHEDLVGQEILSPQQHLDHQVAHRVHYVPVDQLIPLGHQLRVLHHYLHHLYYPLVRWVPVNHVFLDHQVYIDKSLEFVVSCCHLKMMKTIIATMMTMIIYVLASQIPQFEPIRPRCQEYLHNQGCQQKLSFSLYLSIYMYTYISIDIYLQNSTTPTSLMVELSLTHLSWGENAFI